MFKYFDEWLFYLHAFDIIEMIIEVALIIMFMFYLLQIDYIIIVHVDQQILETPPQLDYYWNNHLEYKSGIMITQWNIIPFIAKWEMSHVGPLWPSGGQPGYCVLRRPCHVQGPCPTLQGFSLVNSFDKLYRILIFVFWTISDWLYVI